MSVHIMSYVWKHSKTKGNTLLVFLAIADNANDDGWAYPSAATLAEKTRMTPRNVKKLIDQLEKQKEVVVYNRVSDDEDQQHFSNVYFIPSTYSKEDCPPVDLKGVLKRRTSTEETQPDTTVVSHETLPSVTPDTTVVSNGSPEPLQEPSSNSPQETTTTVVDESELKPEPPKPAIDPEAIGKVVRAYESHIGMITPHIKELLVAAVESYPLEWILEAINIAVENNVLKWRYAGAILESWRTKGKTGGKKILSIEDAPTNEALAEQARLRELKAKAAAEEQARLREKAQERSA